MRAHVVGLVPLALAIAACGSSDDGGASNTGGAAGFGGSGAIGGTAGWPGTGATSGASGAGNAAGTGGSETGGTGGSATNPICLGSQAGAYCGDDEMQDADPDTLYDCPGANQSPTSSTFCESGCVVENAGTPDHCALPTSGDSYRLPWPPGITMKLTQDCNDSCCGDHINDDGYAWDFANGGAFTVVAARSGTVTHLKINSTNGCGSSSCVDDANLIVIDHGDGTAATYLHLQGASLASGVSCGATVQRGQALATAGTTGWSTGIHLHFQVGQVHAGAATCECGAAGTGCSSGSVPWSSFWSTPQNPTLQIAFDEWPEASSCADRRITMPASQNQ